eukprot:scaffold24790_cov53-Phaeocystis_antarctica.AAC.1
MARLAFFFFFLDFLERACALACSAVSSIGIAASARAAHAACAACIACGATATLAGCAGAACCRMGSAVFVRPCALDFRARRRGRRCRSARCWPPAMRVRLKATVAIAPSITQSTTHVQASGAHRAKPRPSERHAACCWMRAAGGVALSIEQLGVGLGSQQRLHAWHVSSASGLNEGGDTAPGLQVRVGRVLQEDEQDGQVAVVRGSHERRVAEAALQVDTRTSFQQHRDDLKVAVA